MAQDECKSAAIAEPIAPPIIAKRQSVVPDSAAKVAQAVNKLAWPVILENLFQTALTTIDMMMVGRLGAAAIAGIGTSGQILWVVQAAIAAITTGTTVLVAHCIGAGKTEEANHVVKQSLIVGLLISVIFAVLGHFYSYDAVKILGADPNVVKLGGQYLQIVMISIVFMVTMFVVGGALRGAGDTQTPMKVTGAINIINIVVGYSLIFGKFGLPQLGVAGSAYGATIARMCGSLALLYFAARGKKVISIWSREGWLLNKGLIWRIVRLGFPSMMEQLFMSGGNLLYGVIAISLGTTVYATQRITFQAISISFMPGMGFAMAATAMVGQCLGAKRSDMAEKSSWYSVRMAVIWMSTMGLLMSIFAKPVMSLFTNDPEIIAIGSKALFVIALSQPFQAVGQVLAGSLRGAGDTRFPMVATFLGIWLIRVPFGYLFGPILGWGLSGIYIANVLDAMARALANLLRYRNGKWRNIKV